MRMGDDTRIELTEERVREIVREELKEQAIRRLARRMEPEEVADLRRALRCEAKH